MTDHDLDQMARALGLDGRLDAARHFCASLVSDMEELNRANKNLVVARDEARALVRRCHHMIRLITKFEMSFAMGGGEEKLKVLMEELEAQDWLKEGE